jgi:hypothetical protein
MRGLRSGAISAALAAAILALLGIYGRSVLTVFEPQQFQPVPVTRAELRDLHLLPHADDIGVQRVVRKPQRRDYDSIAAAQPHVPFRLLQPSQLPPGFGKVRTYSALTPGEMTFTFSAAKAAVFERRSHETLPPMPPNLNGTTVAVHTGTVFTEHFERTTPPRSGEFFNVFEAQVPRVSATGAGLQTLEHYVLTLPNVSPELAHRIEALGDIQHTIPVPVIAGKQTARRVTVRGVSGLEVGDDTGLGAGVVWQERGVVYVVAGPLDANRIIAVADGLR